MGECTVLPQYLFSRKRRFDILATLRRGSICPSAHSDSFRKVCCYKALPRQSAYTESSTTRFRVSIAEAVVDECAIDNVLEENVGIASAGCGNVFHPLTTHKMHVGTPNRLLRCISQNVGHSLFRNIHGLTYIREAKRMVVFFTA